MFLYFNTRELEILEATKRIYTEKSYREINIKEISLATSMSRSSIYNYFQTKEEIFLVLLAIEYDKFCENITSFTENHQIVSKEEIAILLANQIKNQPLMTKILSNNLEDFEVFSRMEIIIYFKRAYSNMINTVDKLLEKFLQHWHNKRREKFIYQFLPYLFGVYVYTHVTDKQKQALKEVNSNFIYFDVYEFMYIFVKQLLID